MSRIEEGIALSAAVGALILGALILAMVIAS